MTSAFEHIPPLPDKPAKRLIQTIHLYEGDQPIGQAAWCCGSDGIVQLMQLDIDERHLRQGHGHRLLEEVLRQARLHHRRLDVPLRRAWMLVEQKSQIIGRAFLTDHGFHHVATAAGLYHDQDGLIYMRAFD